MNTSRRGFIGTIFAAAALVATKDPDELLFRPGVRVFSIPAPQVVAPTIEVVGSLPAMGEEWKRAIDNPHAFLYYSSKVAGPQVVRTTDGHALTRDQILMASGLDHSQYRWARTYPRPDISR